MPSQTDGPPSFSATAGEREATGPETTREAAFGSSSPATNLPVLARTLSLPTSSDSIGGFRVDQDLQYLTDCPFSADGFSEG